MSSIKPRKMRWIDIREQAEAFRQQYVHPVDIVPVPIEEIIEFDLQLNIWPVDGLLSKIDIDGFLSNDLRTIFVDKTIYMDQRYYRRLRFTYAHEIGHLVLHQQEIEQCQFRTEAEWLRFREEMSEDDLFWFEQQAYEFAGRLLVPKKRLIEELNKCQDKINRFRELAENENEELLIQAISRVICDRFDVSDSVISKRIKSEKVWDEES